MRLRTFAMVALLLGLQACTSMGAAYRLGNATVEHELLGRCLTTRSNLGSKVYEDIRKYSSTVREYVEDHGPPAYVMIEQPGTLIQFTVLYPARDTAVYFRDPSAITPTFGRVIEERPMPRALFGRMSDADQVLATNDRPEKTEVSLYGKWQEVYREQEKRRQSFQSKDRRR